MPLEAFFVSNKRCLVCNMFFGCKSRVLQHLRHTWCGVSLKEGACPLIDGPVFDDRDPFSRCAATRAAPFRHSMTL